MNISLRGKIEKNGHMWILRIGIFDEVIVCEKSLECLKTLERKIQEDLGSRQLKCFYKIQDQGVFYLVIAHTAEIIDFLADRLKDIEDLKIDGNLEE